MLETFAPKQEGILAGNHRIVDAGASQSMAPKARFGNHGKWLKSEGKNSHALGPKKTLFKFGVGVISPSVGAGKTEMCAGGNWF